MGRAAGSRRQTSRGGNRFASGLFPLVRLAHPTRPTPGRRCRAGIGAAPIGLVVSSGHEAVERRPGPIAHVAHQTVLDGIPMHVVDTGGQVFFVFDRVFPEASLPDGAFPMTASERLHALLAALRQVLAGEAFLDLRPAQRVVGVARGKVHTACR